ncbi:MAG: hypothetical protein ACKN9U_09310, partial [Pirellulaceae bacterium]
QFPEEVASAVSERPWLGELVTLDNKQIENFLREEEDIQRQADEAYWKPLKEELTQMRLNRERRKH